MKKIDALVNFITHSQGLNKQDAQKQIAAIIAAIVLFFSGAIYFIYQKSNTEILNIKELYKLKSKSAGLLFEYQKIAEEEDRISALLDKNKDFTIKSYFEKLSKDNNLTADSSWGDTYEVLPIAGSDKFEEERLKPTFKNLNTQSLLVLLEKLEEDPMLHVRDVVIAREENNLIATIIITAKKYTKGY